MNRYEEMFRAVGARDEGAFGAFVMLGDPDLGASARILDTLVASGADMIEVGIPFSDPIADGPVVQAAALRALVNGTRPRDCFAQLAEFRARHAEIPVGILTYANLVVARGRASFYRAAAEAGVDSVLIADVPTIEAEPFVSCARAQGIAPVLIAAQNTPAPTLREIARLSEGYTYCVARAGVTGARDALRLEHEDMFATLAAAGATPPVIGFGISRPDHVRQAVRAGAAGVICGSAIVERIATSPANLAELYAFVGAMKAATRLETPATPEPMEALDVR